MIDPKEMIEFFAVQQKYGKRLMEGRMKRLYKDWCNDTGYGYDETDVEAGFYGGFSLALDKVLELIDNECLDEENGKIIDRSIVYIKAQDLYNAAKALKGGTE